MYINYALLDFVRLYLCQFRRYKYCGLNSVKELKESELKAKIRGIKDYKSLSRLLRLSRLYRLLSIFDKSEQVKQLKLSKM